MTEADRLSGLVCSNCLTKFVEAHGQPVLCPKCKYDLLYDGRYGNLPRSWFEEEVRREPPQKQRGFAV